MEKRVALKAHGKTLWTREKALPIRQEVENILGNAEPGDVVALDMKGVEAFDFSFANEFFGKLLLSLPNLYPGCFIVVEGLSAYTRENLAHALQSLGLVALERRKRSLALLGKIHPTDLSTFEGVRRKRGSVTASQLSDELTMSVTAMNERLSKLTGLGVLRRETTHSPAGREQYQYSLPR